MNIEIPVKHNKVDNKFIKLTSDDADPSSINLQHCGPAYKGYQYSRSFYNIDKQSAIAVAKAIIQYYNVDINNIFNK